MSHILIPAVAALSNALFSKQNSHPGLRQQVIATQIKNLSKEINELVAHYDASIEELNKARKALSQARHTQEKIAGLKAQISTQERELLSSHIPLKITKLKATLNNLNYKILEEDDASF